MSRREEAVDNTRAAEAEKYRKDLALFRTVLTAVDGSSEPDQVLGRALRTILEALGPGFAGMILRSDPQHPGLEVAASVGLPVKDPPHWVFTEGCLCSQPLETGMPLFEPDCPGPEGSGCRCHIAFGEIGPHGHLIVPLKTRQRPMGVLCIFCPPNFTIATPELSAWEDIGIQIGRAIEDANLRAQLQRERELLQALYNVSDHLAASLDLDWVLSRVLELSISATAACDGSVFLLPAEDAPMSRILRRNLPPAEADLVIEQVLSRGLAGWVVRHKEGTIIYDTTQDPRWLFLPDDPNPPRSVLAVPLMAGGRVLGVLTLNHPETGHFHDRQMILMMAIGHQASAAVEKARLHKEVAHLAQVLAQRVEERTRELKETQMQLIQAEKLAALGELAAGIAHEINNPLHILQAYVEYMGTRLAADDPLQEFLRPMRDALENIARLAVQLRDFSRPTSGEWQPVDINHSLTNVLRLVRKELMHCKVEVEPLLAPDPPMVMGDARQIEQVFLNLILNARDAMPGGGWLQIETRADTDTVHVRFADSGMGIPEEALPRIFEPYFTTKEVGGTGLGLAICQRIVSQHGGQITVSSRVGQGTVFTVHLSARRPG